MLDLPVHTCPLQAGSWGSPHCVLKAVLSVSRHAYAPAMTIVWPLPGKDADSW